MARPRTTPALQTILAEEVFVGWDSSARVEEAELTEASEDLLMAEALLSGVPGRDRESLC